MTSAKFREQTSSMAFKFQRGQLCVAQILRGDTETVPEMVQERCKVRKLYVPNGHALTLPAALAASGLELFGHAGVPVLGVASTSAATVAGYVDLRCWLLSTAAGQLTWRELPRRTLIPSKLRSHPIAVRLVPEPTGTRFQVIVTKRDVVMTCSLDWRQQTWTPTWKHNYSSYAQLKRRIQCLSEVRYSPHSLEDFDLIVDSINKNIFAYGLAENGTSLALYKWDESSWKWMCVFSERPDGWHEGCTTRMSFYDVKAQISGDNVLISTHVSGTWEKKAYYPDVLMYQIPSDTSKWFRTQTADTFLHYDKSVASLISLASVNHKCMK